MPHSDEEREQLASYMDEIRSIAEGGERERAVELLRDLLAIGRSVLGPVHPLTLHVQVDFAAMPAAVGETAMATMMLLDVAHTAQHYYGTYHPARYLVCGGGRTARHAPPSASHDPQSTRHGDRTGMNEWGHRHGAWFPLAD